MYESRGIGRIRQKVLFLSAGNDGTGALNNIERICTRYQFKKIHEPAFPYTLNLWTLRQYAAKSELGVLKAPLIYPRYGKGL